MADIEQRERIEAALRTKYIDTDGVVAALDANGLTITTTERAAIGEAVENLPPTWRLARHALRPLWRVQVDGWGSGSADTLPAAIIAALKEVQRD